MTVDVMKEIEAFEQAQAEYQREQTRKGIVDGFKAVPHDSAERTALKALVDINGQFAGDEGDDAVRTRIAKELAADLSLTDDELPGEFSKRIDREFTRRENYLADIESGFAAAETELTQKADPFNGEYVVAPESEQNRWRNDYTNFLLETQLTGGLPKDRAGIAAAVERAINTKSAGALQFWMRNFETMYRNTGAVMTPADAKQGNALLERMDRALDGFRSSLAQTSASQLRKARKAWENHRIKSKVQDARAALSVLRGIRAPQKFGRTEAQSKKAALNRSIRQQQAEIARLGQ